MWSLNEVIKDSFTSIVLQRNCLLNISETSSTPSTHRWMLYIVSDSDVCRTWRIVSHNVFLFHAALPWMFEQPGQWRRLVPREDKRSHAHVSPACIWGKKNMWHRWRCQIHRRCPVRRGRTKTFPALGIRLCVVLCWNVCVKPTQSIPQNNVTYQPWQFTSLRQWRRSPAWQLNA